MVSDPVLPARLVALKVTRRQGLPCSGVSTPGLSDSPQEARRLIVRPIYTQEKAEPESFGGIGRGGCPASLDEFSVASAVPWSVTPQSETRKTMNGNWQVRGTYFEACNCTVVCPCNFLSAPTEGECKVVVAWHIDDGSYGAVDLSGMNVALFAHAPGHMMEAKWKVALYTDERASQEQAEALAKIFSGQEGGHLSALGPFIGEVLGVKSVPIEYRAEGNRRSVRVGSVAEAEIEAVTGQGDQPVEISNIPFTVVPDVPLVLSKSSRCRYDDYGVSMDISERNGYYSPFAYQA